MPAVWVVCLASIGAIVTQETALPAIRVTFMPCGKGGVALPMSPYVLALGGARCNAAASHLHTSRRLELLIAGVLKLEREFWPLAEGPWEGPDGAAHRVAWGSTVRLASSIQEVCVVAGFWCLDRGAAAGGLVYVKSHEHHTWRPAALVLLA